MIQEQINIQLGGPQNNYQECNTTFYPDGITINYNNTDITEKQISNLSKEQAIKLAKSILTYFSEDWQPIDNVPPYLDVELINPEETGLEINYAFFNSKFKEWRDSLSGSGLLINPKYWRTYD